MIKPAIVQVAEAALQYIDAIPKDVAASLPAMPGFDRDWAGAVIAETLSVARGEPTDEMVDAFLRSNEFSFAGYSRESVAEGLRRCLAVSQAHREAD